jgi:hypothetical protein
MNDFAVYGSVISLASHEKAADLADFTIIGHQDAQPDAIPDTHYSHA